MTALKKIKNQKLPNQKLPKKKAELSFLKVRKQSKNLKTLIKNLGNSKDTFTYFDSRSLDVLDNHLLTTLLCKNKEPIGYGHLDKDGDTIWLGICVIEKEMGNGYGKLIMNYLTSYADKHKINLTLSVHKVNEVACHLYKKFGFKIKKENEKSYFFFRNFIENI